MFSGIVEEAATISGVEERRDGEHRSLRLTVDSALDHSVTKLGDSICIGGACLTVIEKLPGTRGTRLVFDVAPETVRRTTLGGIAAGKTVNLERSMVVGDRVHGHFVTGHVDGVTRLLRRTDEGNSIQLDFALPEGARGMIVTKGSIAISGVSLTVGPVTSDHFTVWIIPHTAAVTTLGQLREGDSVNFEFDMVARYVSGLLQGRIS